MRRILLAGLLVLAVGLPPVSARAEPHAPETVDPGARALAQAIQQRIERFSGNAAIYVADPLRRRLLVSISPDEPVVAASLYKLAALVAVERMVERAELDYAHTIEITWDDITEDGSFYPAGAWLSVDEALEAMVTLSDNGSALALLRLAGGAPAVNALMRELDLGGLRIAERWEEENEATPRAVGSFFDRAVRGEMLSAAASARMLDRLKRQQVRDRIPAQLPQDTVVAHKTGNLGYATHDAGVIWTADRPLTVVVETWNAPEDEAVEFIQDIASLVYAFERTLAVIAGFSVPARVGTEIGRIARAYVAVANLGERDWPASGDGAVVLRAVLDERSGSVRVPVGPLRTGESVALPVTVMPPPAPGSYTVHVGLEVRSGDALRPLTDHASFALEVHQPRLVSAVFQVPSILHAGEISAVWVLASALPALEDARTLRLGWRIRDQATGRIRRQGSSPLGSIDPQRPLGALTWIEAPRSRGEHELELFVIADERPVSESLTRTVHIVGARTYPD